VAAGSSLGAVVEVDTGMDRSGAGTRPRRHWLLPSTWRRCWTAFAGLTGYEGHCALMRTTIYAISGCNGR